MSSEEPVTAPEPSGGTPLTRCPSPSPQAPEPPARRAAAYERLRALAEPRGLPHAAQRRRER